MKYLIDEALIVESLVQDEVNEATGKKEKNYYIEGIFSTPNQKNRNGRIYPLSLWEREVAKYQEEIKSNSMNTLGEWEHPARTTVDPLEAVMKIVYLNENEININELWKYLKELLENNPHILDDKSFKNPSELRRIIRIYDWLKYKEN